MCDIARREKRKKIELFYDSIIESREEKESLRSGPNLRRPELRAQ